MSFLNILPQFKSIFRKGATFGIILTNISTNSFANNINTNSYKYDKEIKSNLEEFTQREIKSNKVDTWETGLSDMPTARNGLSGAVIDDKIYCLGGFNSSKLNTIEVYNPKTDTWDISKAPMPTSRQSFISESVNGKIYAIGGNTTNSVATGIVEIYDPVTNTWSTGANMPTPRKDFTSAVVDNKIYVIGGWNGNSQLDLVEIYDPVTDTWSTGANMPTARSELSSAVIDNKIYCIGGNNGSLLNQVEVYNTTTNTWDTSKTPMPLYISNNSSVAIEKNIYCIGGYNGEYLTSVYIYNSDTDKWKEATRMPTRRSGFIAKVVGSKIYCIGGYNNYTQRQSKVEAYIAKVSRQEEIVEQAEASRNPVDIENARDLINQLPESIIKDELQNRLDAIFPDLELERESASANLDIYIKSENMLSFSLDTNSVTFEDFSGVEDVVKENAINLTVSSSLPYKINVYMPTEIKGSENNIMSNDILNIRANGQTTYNTFVDTSTPIILLDDQSKGNDVTHGIDLMLKGDVSHNKDVYKTTIKFEVVQK